MGEADCPSGWIPYQPCTNPPSEKFFTPGRMLFIIGQCLWLGRWHLGQYVGRLETTDFKRPGLASCLLITLAMLIGLFTCSCVPLGQYWSHVTYSLPLSPQSNLLRAPWRILSPSRGTLPFSPLFPPSSALLLWLDIWFAWGIWGPLRLLLVKKAIYYV